jgi:hypothetical protein
MYTGWQNILMTLVQRLGPDYRRQEGDTCRQICLSRETFVSHKFFSLVFSCFPSQYVLDIELSGLLKVNKLMNFRI